MKVGGRGDWRRRVRERQKKRRVAMRGLGWYMTGWYQQRVGRRFEGELEVVGV